jgi:GT2 family glycosyltransferase
LSNSKNLGFGKANNQGAQLTKTKYILFLNPDCYISLESVSQLISTLSIYKNAAIAAPQTWNTYNLPQISYRQPFFEKINKIRYEVPDGITSAKWISGCCLMTRTEEFLKVGGFDENIFLYFEDDELCLKFIQAGYDCLIDPNAMAIHKGGASSKSNWKINFKKEFFWLTSRHYMINKYLGKKKARNYLYKTIFASTIILPFYIFSFQLNRAVKWLAWCLSSISLLLSSKNIKESLNIL